MGNLEGYGLMSGNFSRHNSYKLWCWRGCRRQFCSERKNTVLSDLEKTGIDLSNNISVANKINTKLLIASKDLDKRILIYNSYVSIIDKIFAFKMHKCGKFIDLTKTFLTDSKFLKFSYYLIKNTKGAQIQLDGINDKWFEKTADKIKNSLYKFKPAKQVSDFNLNKENNRIITIINSKDIILQKAMTILLELIYENNDYFHEESHGFRPNKSSHTALHQIKMEWHALPYYIQMDIDKVFDNINHKVLINMLNEKISDKRFIDLLNQMYNVNTLCPENFRIKNNNCIMLGNVLSPILCNIYFNKLDTYIKDEIINKMIIGKKPQSNPEYINKIGLLDTEQKLPEHIKNKIKKSRRRHVQKLGIKRIIENEDFIRIKYVRYADDFIIAVRGSLELAKKIKNLVINFLKGTLHLKISEEKTKITNTYSNKVLFLGMYIYNMNENDLPYRNSRMVENTKRVIRKNNALKNNIKIKIMKNTRNKIISLLHEEKNKEKVIDAIKILGNKGKIRTKIRKLTEAVYNMKTEKEKTMMPNTKFLYTVPKLKVKTIPINKENIKVRIHTVLTKFNACSLNRGLNNAK